MSRDLTQRGEGAIVEEGDRGELAPRREGSFSFRYSYRSITSVGGKTHVHAKEQRFEEGKLETEEIEATVDGSVYEEAADRAGRAFVDQMGLLWSAWSSLLQPFLPPRGDDDDDDRR